MNYLEPMVTISLKEYEKLKNTKGDYEETNLKNVGFATALRAVMLGGRMDAPKWISNDNFKVLEDILRQINRR